MKNIAKILFATVGVALMFAACHKEGALPFYKNGTGSIVLNSPSPAVVTAAVADSGKTALTLTWSWPNYATDSAHQKFIVEIDSTGHNFAKPWARVLTGKTGTTFTGKDLNMIVFGFGSALSTVNSLDVRVVSSYANNNELYISNVVNVKVTPYIIPVTITLTPAGPLTLTMANANSTAFTAKWNATQFGNQALNYAIQVIKSGGVWTSATVKPVNNALTGAYTVQDLNRLAQNLGIAPGASGTLNIRVVAYQGANYANPVYSNVVNLNVTTYLDVVKFFVVGSYNGWDNSDAAATLANIPANGAQAEGFVNLSNIQDGFKLTTDHSWDDAHTYGDDGTNTGKLSNVGGGKNIMVPSVGYYQIQANPVTMTYSTTQTFWGVIGSATPGGWGSQTDMVYFPTQKIFGLGMSLVAGEYKFRGTSSWSINLGLTSPPAGSALAYNGGNIPVATAGDYALTLDLSHPNAYTYSANMWGVIGSATAGGWNSDQNMAWDATNGVFTATLALTVGEIKFRANDDWGINLGAPLNALTYGGPNIAIANAGNYKITLNPWTLVATVTQL